MCLVLNVIIKLLVFVVAPVVTRCGFRRLADIEDCKWDVVSMLLGLTGKCCVLAKLWEAQEKDFIESELSVLYSINLNL